MMKLNIVETVFHLLENQMCFKAARLECEKLGPTWALPDYRESESLLQYMKYKGISSMWLALQKKHLNDWTWIDGSKCQFIYLI